MKQEHKWYAISALFAISAACGLIRLGMELCKATA